MAKSSKGSTQLLPVTFDDLPSIVALSELAFPFDPTNNLELLPLPLPSLRNARLLKRLEWMWGDQDCRMIKAVDLSRKEEEGRGIVGLAQWLIPGSQVLSLFRRGRHRLLEKAVEEDQRWNVSEQEEQWAWEGVNASVWESVFVATDKDRKEIMQGRGHWFLCPLWVIPTRRHEGIATLLLKEVLDTHPTIPVYLEATTYGQPVYEKLGFKVVFTKEGNEIKYPRMVRRGTGGDGRSLCSEDEEGGGAAVLVE